MRILSLNAWGGHLYDRLVPFVESAGADIICLQEMIDAPGASRASLTYRDDGAELMQRSNVFSEIATVLPEHNAFFLTAARGDLYDGPAAVSTFWGLATYTRRSIAILGQAQGFVHGNFDPTGFGPHPRARNAHVMRLLDPATSRTFVVAQMHGLRDPSGKQDTPARHAQASTLVELIRSVRHDGEPLLVCGDFNTLPDSQTFDVLRSLGVVDLVGHTDTRTSYYSKSPRSADYMLVSPDIDVVAFNVVEEPEVSDHRPLLLDFRLAASG